MQKVVNVGDKISVHLDMPKTEPSFITIEDRGGHVFIDVSDWENLKQAVDGLLVDSKDW